MILSQYFTFPDSTCSFSYCSMYLGATLYTSVTVTYSGTGSTATAIFNIDTSLPFTANLNLGCNFLGSSNIALSTNTIAFIVNPCPLTGISAISNSYIYLKS